MKKRAEKGEIILLYQDETIVWRFAIPRSGWWYKKERARIDELKENHSRIRKEEREKREAWKQYRRWDKIKSGVLLCIIGAVEYLTSKFLYKTVAHFDCTEFLMFLYQVLLHYKNTNKKIVMIVDNSGVHKANRVKALLEKRKDDIELYFLPPHSGHQLNAIEGLWRPVKDAVGANRGHSDIKALHKRTRLVLQRHKDNPIFHFNWQRASY